MIMLENDLICIKPSCCGTVFNKISGKHDIYECILYGERQMLIAYFTECF